MRAIFAACAVFGLLLPWAAVRGQGSMVLDLSSPAAVRQLDALTGECTGGRSVAALLHHPETWRKPQVLLKLEILDLSGTSFKIGDYMTAELRLTNVGEAAIMLPWDIHASTVYGPKPTCKWPKEGGAVGLREVLAVYLEAESGKSGRGYGSIVYLYGISTEPNSYRSLPPGKTATFKISSAVSVPPEALAGQGAIETAQFTAFAVLKLDDSAERGPYEDIRSNNQFTVYISPKWAPKSSGTPENDAFTLR